MAAFKLTKQGVRDLNDLGPKVRTEKAVLPCEHRRLRECCPPKTEVCGSCHGLLWVCGDLEEEGQVCGDCKGAGKKHKPGCGHFSCPDCGLTWDEGFEGHWPGS